MGENIVQMGNNTQQEKKLSYEELQETASQLSAQNQQLVAKLKDLYTKCQELNQNNMFVRLEWLWRVIDKRDYFDGTFVSKCMAEFKEIMMPEPEEDTIKE